MNKIDPVVKPGEFVFSAMHLDHGHIIGMCDALIAAGATLKSVYDPNPEKVAAFLKSFPQALPALSEKDVLNDLETRLIAAAAVTSERCALGIRVMAAGKDYFTDKAPLTTLEQLNDARECVKRTGRKYLCYYSEFLHSESGLFAKQLIKDGAIGRMLCMNGFGPHRLNPASRADWFFEKEKSGGILCDLGSHQIEQFLQYSGETEAQIVMSRVANYNHPQYPSFEDFGDCAMVTPHGTTLYFRVDWFTPDGLRTWGDSRVFITGTEGTLELRKTVDPAVPEMVAHTVILVDGQSEKRYMVQDKIRYPFFGALILDCLNRTENAMTQAHCFKAAELCVQASQTAARIW